MANPVEVIDWNVYGALMRNTRMKNGYKNMDDFARGLWLRARVKVGKETLYKIEQGKQPPSVETFFGINLVLFGEFLPEKLFSFSVCDEWKAIGKYTEDYFFSSCEPYVPSRWAEENRAELQENPENLVKPVTAPEEDGGFEYDDALHHDEYVSPEICAYNTSEPACVFGGRRIIHGEADPSSTF